MSWFQVLVGGWEPLVRTAVVGVLGYAALVLLLRGAGKRSLSKFNAFDFVVTVALGSTLASLLTSQSTPLAQGVAALALLIGLQFGITWLSVRSGRVRELVKGEPTLLVHLGEYLDGALRRERVSREEVLAAARDHGVHRVRDIRAAVLETDGSISVLKVDDTLDEAPRAGEDHAYPLPTEGR